jgi:ribulose-5-phosphate 4-epimerase/fuculose-1-phosphate aldolase
MALCCRQLAARGLIAGQDGNLSVQTCLPRAVTPRGVIKGLLSPSDMVEVDLSGHKRRGRRNPTSELDLHLRILARRADVGAVVHAHPPTATGFAVAGEGFEKFVLPEIILLFGRVPLVPYGTTGTPGGVIRWNLHRPARWSAAREPRRRDGGSHADAAWIRMSLSTRREFTRPRSDG